MLRCPGLIKSYCEEKVYISSGCQTLLFHMWSCHKQWNCTSCTNWTLPRKPHWEELLCCHASSLLATNCTCRYEILDMHDSKLSMHDVASPSPAFDTDDGSSPFHFFLVSHHSLHDNPLFYSPRSQSYLSKTKHIRSNAWKRETEMCRWSGRRASPLRYPETHKRGNLKFQPAHTGNQHPVSRASQSERGVEILGVVCIAKGVSLQEWTRVTSVCFTCVSLHNSNTCMMLAVANEIRSTIKCEQSYYVWARQTRAGGSKMTRLIRIVPSNRIHFLFSDNMSFNQGE